MAERFSLRNLYLYLVCLITLVMSIFAAVNLVESIVELLYPERGDIGYDPRRHAVIGLVSSATTLAIAAPVYLYHWRRIQKELPPRGERG